MFPPFKVMKYRNPILKKIPVLLPWFYFTRLLKGMFNFKKSKAIMNSINNTSQDKNNEIKELHDKLGVKNKL